jgi:hypothetical protein
MIDYSQYITIPNSSYCASLYSAGQLSGLRSGVFAKIGHSFGFWQYNLGTLGHSRPVIIWGDQSHLSSTVTFFSTTTARLTNSFADRSVACLRGGTTSDILSLLSNYNASFRYDNAGALCSGKTALVCAYDTLSPAYSIIILGTTELGTDANTFKANMQSIIDYTISRNIIPIIVNITKRSDADYSSAINIFNTKLSEISTNSNIPLVDVYSAFNSLGSGNNYGLSVDNIHPSWPTNGNTADFTSTGQLYGYNILNLCLLEALRLVRSAAGG